ncbi:MAG: DMT family transporter [Actinobacteria bacterium]|nr:DMT family transporter [Actinomycetota bacterium]
MLVASGETRRCADDTTGVKVLSIALAILAAVANATASVLQRKAARNERDSRSGLAMLWDLARQPVWIGGIAAVIVGFLLQAGALATGPVALVQPILILELGFTLLLAGVVFRSRLHRREWVAVAGMSIGLALLLFALQPSGGDPLSASLAAWVAATVVTVALLGLLVGLAHRRRSAARAALLGVATGIGFGFIAALVAAIAAAHAAHGIPGVITAWQTYVVIALGPLFFFLLQKALQAGRLVASQPALTISNPIVAFGFGVAVFGEHVQGGAWLVLALLAAGLITVATVMLARSPLLHGARGRSETPAGSRPAGSGSPDQSVPRRNPDEPAVAGGSGG